MNEEQPALQGFAPGCSLWFTWVLASSLGTGIGWFLGWRLSFLMPGNLATLTIGMTSGLVLGLFQGFVLRTLLDRPGRWVAATVLGWVIGFPLGVSVAQMFGMVEAFLGLITGMVMGGILAIFQWSTLRGQVSRAGWWVPASLFGWSSAMLYYQPSPTLLGILYGLLAGMVTGIALVWLLYRPVDEGD